MKICLLAIVTLLSSYLAWGQDSINQQTKFGQKKGQWVEFYPNGKIKEVIFWKPISRRATFEEAFNMEYNRYANDTVYFSKRLWHRYYEYYPSWDLLRIRHIDSVHRVTYLFGSNQEIELAKTNFNSTGRVDQTDYLTLSLTNNSTSPVQLQPEYDESVFITEQIPIGLLPNKSAPIQLSYRHMPMDSTYKVLLMNDSLRVEVSLRTFGYHVKSEDILHGDELKLGETFIYYRTGGEALLKIYKNESNEEIKTISLAKHKQEIDLSFLDPGTYTFCTINFSTDRKDCCKARVAR